MNRERGGEDRERGKRETNRERGKNRGERTERDKLERSN